jgi:hypothetical protein
VSTAADGPRCAICLATDAGYLVPALVAAGQARRWSSPHLADVVLLAFGLDRRALAAAEPVCAEAGVRLLPVPAGDPLMARLLLDSLIPAQFTEFLHLDCDVQVIASLDRLLAAPVPPGRIRAALDPMALLVRAGGRGGARRQARMQAAGVAAANCADYFNAGVFHIAREAWAAIGAKALALFQATPPGQPFPDQDALNIAAAGRVEPLSLAWNFPIFLRNAGLHRAIQPAILHFMARPKPWQGSFPPWSATETRPYADVLMRHPALADYLAPMPRLRWLRYAVQQQVKRELEALKWGRGRLRAVVLESEDRVVMPANE